MADIDSSCPRQMMTIQQARERGLVRYFSGAPCAKGHVCDRFTSSRGCVECAAIRAASDHRAEYLAKYLSDNAERLKAEKRAHYHQNKARIQAVQLQYREKNRQRIRDVGKDYRLKNPEKARAIGLNASHRRRALMKGGMTGPELHLWKRTVPKICHWCGCKCADSFEIDHYVPLSRGGRHEESNLVVACGPCNATKRDKDPIEFAKSRGRLF